MAHRGVMLYLLPATRPPELLPYPFRFRDPLTGRWVRARYKSMRVEIAARYTDAGDHRAGGNPAPDRQGIRPVAMTCARLMRRLRRRRGYTPSLNRASRAVPSRQARSRPALSNGSDRPKADTGGAHYAYRMRPQNGCRLAKSMNAFSFVDLWRLLG